MIDCLRTLPKAKRWRSERNDDELPALRPGRCRVAILRKHLVLTNYRGRAEHRQDLKSLVNEECHKLWPGASVSTITDEKLDDIGAAPRLMVASLFFIELPRACSSASRHSIHVRCRLPLGNHLLNICKRLRDDGARIDVRTNSSHQSAEFCDDEHWERIRAQDDYDLAIPIGPVSHRSLIHVTLKTTMGEEYVSNCPYQLSDLIRDQGLETAWAARDAGEAEVIEGRANARDSNSQLYTDIDQLRTTLAAFSTEISRSNPPRSIENVGD